MNSFVASFFLLAALMISTSFVSAQTFQYSRGWTNGKRSSMVGNGMYEMSLVDRLLANPCQLEKLRYILQGKPLNEKLMVPCDLLSMGPVDNEPDSNGLRLRRSISDYEQRNQDNRPELL